MLSRLATEQEIGLLLFYDMSLLIKLGHSECNSIISIIYCLSVEQTSFSVPKHRNHQSKHLLLSSEIKVPKVLFLSFQRDCNSSHCNDVFNDRKAITKLKPGYENLLSWMAWIETRDHSCQKFLRVKISRITFNPFTNDKIFDGTKLKKFEDNKLNVAKMTISLFDIAENNMGKGENAGYQHFLKRRKCWLPAFSPFLTLFSKAFF